MSLQDDYEDLRLTLIGTKELPMLEHIWFAFCDLETRDMVDDGKLTKAEYCEWRAKRVTGLKAEGYGVGS